MSTRESVIVDFTVLLLGTLGHAEGEFTALGYEDTDGEFHTAVYTPSDAPGVLDQIPATANTFFGVNTVVGPPRRNCGRGKETDVTRLTGLWCDLDVKTGGCPSLDIAQAIIANLSIILGTRPSVIVESGHGLHPYWPISDGHITGGDIGAARALLKRWGRLVASVADQLHASVDNVYDLARMMRAPGTLNNKTLGNGNQPIPVTAHADSGAPLTVAEIDERLTEVGILEEPGDRDADTEQVSNPGEWRYAEHTCPYVAAILTNLPTDGPPPPGKAKKGCGRHQWAASQAVKLTCALRRGCITETDWARAHTLLKQRLTELRAATNETVPRHEIGGLFKLGRQRAATKTDEQCRTELGGHTHAAGNGAEVFTDPPAAPAGPLCVEHLEGGFWERDSLKIIFDAALARMCSPWAVLAYCAARALAQVRPCVVLPPVICGPGSLNWFGIITAVSGGGKDGASAVAEELVASRVHSCKPGSGEGAVQAYIIRNSKGAVERYREAIMFEASEVDALTALAARTGSNLMPVLRDGFSGAALGFGYSDPKKATYLAKQTYRMTFVLSVQPARAGAIFAGEGGGTPQRFMWFPARDARATRKAAEDRSSHIGKLALPDLRETADWQKYGRTLVIPDEARDLILDEREKNNRGELEALEGHAIFCREKFAYALAILDGRTEMNSEDWRLSGIAATVSAHVRDWVAEQLQQGLRDQAEQEGALRGVGFEAADNEKIIAKGQRIQRVASRALTKLGEAPGGRMKHRDLWSAIAYRDRSVLSAALAQLVAEKRIAHGADAAEWVKL